MVFPLASQSSRIKERTSAIPIALAVMHDPELLILDEPINGLDPIGIAEVRSFIRELCDARGKTFLISSHILSEISLLADDIGFIDHGALLEEESLAELEQWAEAKLHEGKAGPVEPLQNRQMHQETFAPSNAFLIRASERKRRSAPCHTAAFIRLSRSALWKCKTVLWFPRWETTSPTLMGVGLTSRVLTMRRERLGAPCLWQASTTARRLGIESSL